MIESDPEDDVEPPPILKYSRPEGSTPTYNIDTDISTLEAPTFTTLSHGPSHVLQALKWDHPPTLIGESYRILCHLRYQSQSAVIKMMLCFTILKNPLKFENAKNDALLFIRTT